MSQNENLPVPGRRHYFIGRIRGWTRGIFRDRKNRRDYCSAEKVLRERRPARRRAAARPKNADGRILVVETRHLGDVLFATPALRSLKEAFPSAHVTILIRKGMEDLLKDNPAVDEILFYEEDNYVRMVEELSEGRYDMAVLLDRDERLAQLVFQAGIPKRVGYDRPAAARFLTLAVPREEHKRSEIRWSLRLAESSGGLAADERIELFWEARRGGASRAFGFEPNAYVLIHPGSEPAVPYKRWPVERYAEVARRLLERGNTVAISGLEAEQSLARFFPVHPKCVLLFGKTSLKELVGLVADAQLLITNDTGPSHIAAALNRPCIAITGFADPKIYHPYPNPHRVLYHPILCSPCFGTQFDPIDCPYHSCLKIVTVEEVLTNADQLLAAYMNPA